MHELYTYTVYACQDVATMGASLASPRKNAPPARASAPRSKQTSRCAAAATAAGGRSSTQGVARNIAHPSLEISTQAASARS